MLAAGEDDPALGIRDLRLGEGVALPPFEGVKVHRGPGDGPACPARKDDGLLAAFRGAALEEDEVADAEIQGQDPVFAPGEALAGRRGHEIDPRREIGGQLGIGPVVAEVEDRGKVDFPGRGRLGAFEDALDLLPLGKDVVVLGGPDAVGDVRRVGSKIDAVQVPVGEADGPAAGRVGPHRLHGVFWRLDALD